MHRHHFFVTPHLRFCWIPLATHRHHIFVTPHRPINTSQEASHSGWLLFAPHPRRPRRRGITRRHHFGGLAEHWQPHLIATTQRIADAYGLLLTQCMRWLLGTLMLSYYLKRTSLDFSVVTPPVFHFFTNSEVLPFSTSLWSSPNALALTNLPLSLPFWNLLQKPKIEAPLREKGIKSSNVHVVLHLPPHQFPSAIVFAVVQLNQVPVVADHAAVHWPCGLVRNVAGNSVVVVLESQAQQVHVPGRGVKGALELANFGIFHQSQDEEEEKGEEFTDGRCYFRSGGVRLRRRAVPRLCDQLCFPLFPFFFDLILSPFKFCC